MQAICANYYIPKSNNMTSKTWYSQPHYVFEVCTKDCKRWFSDKADAIRAFKESVGDTELWQLKNGTPHKLIKFKEC